MYCAAIKTKRGGFRNVPAPTIDDLWQILREADRSGHEAYFLTASLRSNDSREAENVEALKCFRIDVDYGKEGHGAASYATREDALAAAKAFYKEAALPQPIIVLSGGGLHVYWALKTALPRDEWLRYARGLKAACMTLGLEADHVVTADPARILRAPCTTNRKLPGKPRKVELDPRFLEIAPYELEQFETLLQYKISSPGREAKSAAENVISFNPRPEYLKNCPSRGLTKKLLGGLGFDPADARADPHMIADQCGQLGRMREKLGDGLYEPAWYACLGILTFCEGGEALAHEWSKGDERYDQSETQKKFDAWKKMSGPPTCAGFQGLGGETRARCEACHKFGKITTPVSLGEGVTPPEGVGARVNERAPGGAPGPIKWELTASGKKREKSYPNTVTAIDALGIKGHHDVFHDSKLEHRTFI